MFRRHKDIKLRVRVEKRRPRGVVEVFTAGMGGFPPWKWTCECNGVPNLAWSHRAAMVAACGHLKRGHRA